MEGWGPNKNDRIESHRESGAEMVKQETKTIVSIVQHEDVRFAVREAIKLLDRMNAFVQPEDKVVIKPNLVFALHPFTGFTTDPTVIRTIIELCQTANPSEIIIGEGSGGINTHLAFMSCGYTNLLKDYDVKFVDLNTSPTTNIEVPNGVVVQQLNVPNLILECDVLINVPKLKLYKRIPQRSDWVSLAVKNLLGAVPGKGEYSSTRPSGMAVECSRQFWKPDGEYYHPAYRQWWRPRGERKRIHANLADGLVDVNMVFKPTLNIIDGFIVSNDVNMTTTRAEKPVPLNTILASQDPLALDCIAAKIAGLDPFDINYLLRAAEREIGESDYDRIQVRGTPLKKIKQDWEMLFNC